MIAEAESLTVTPKPRDSLGHTVLAKAVLQNLRTTALAAQAGRTPESAASNPSK